MVCAFSPLDRIEYEGSISTTAATDDRILRAIVYIPAGEGPHPVVLALPSESGSQSDAMAVFRRFSGFANLGYAVVAPDVAPCALGGADLDVVLAWLDFISDHERMDRDKVVITGCSHGAYLAALAACRSNVYGLILASGFYDLDEYMAKELKNARNPKIEAFFAMTCSEIGEPADDSGAYMARSPIDNVESIKSSVLMFHSRRDVRIGESYSQRFADALEAAGRQVDLYILDGFEHDIDITGDETDEMVLQFLKKIGLPCKTDD